MSWLSKILGRPADRGGAATPLGPVGPRFDLLLGDPLAHEWQACLARGDWTDVGDFLRAQDDIEVRDFYLAALSDTMRGWPAWLDTWVEREPHDALPRLMRAWRYTAYAWDARTKASAKDVKQDAWPLFFGRLNKAEADLAVAANLAPDDAGPWALMLRTARGLQMGIPESRRRFAEVERRSPWHAWACQQVIQSVAAKWGGSDELMFEIARGISARAPEGMDAHVVIADAYFEAWDRDDKDYWERPEARTEILEAARRCLSAPHVTPRTVLVRNAFAFCFWQLGERDLLREQLEQIGDIMTTPWDRFADPAAVFARARRYAQAY